MYVCLSVCLLLLLFSIITVISHVIIHSSGSARLPLADHIIAIVMYSVKKKLRRRQIGCQRRVIIMQYRLSSLSAPWSSGWMMAYIIIDRVWQTRRVGRRTDTRKRYVSEGTRNLTDRTTIQSTHDGVSARQSSPMLNHLTPTVAIWVQL